MIPINAVRAPGDGRYVTAGHDALIGKPGPPCDDAIVILDADAAQARVLAAALPEQVRALSERLVKVERQIEQKPHHRSADARREAAG